MPVDELTSGAATPENVDESVKLKVPVADLLVETGNLLNVARTDGNGRLYYSAHLKVYLPVEEIEPQERGVVEAGAQERMPGFEWVTNSVSTDVNEKFLRLQVEMND